MRKLKIIDMANIRFNLRNKNQNTRQTIYLVYNFTSNDKLMYPTQFKIEPKYWNAAKYRVADKIAAKNRSQINTFLNKLETETQNYIIECKAERKNLTKAELRDFLDIYLNKKEPPKELTFFSFINKFIEQSENRINHKTGQNINSSTIQVYKNTLQYLKNFETETRNPLEFKGIDLDFYYNFIAYLEKKLLATNTIGKIIKTLKTFLNDATAKGLNTNLAYKSPRFKILTEESDSIYLTEPEIDKIYNLDFTENPRLDKVRDFFVLACWTGSRFSDISKLTNENIIGDFLEFEQQKTGKKVAIPLHPIVKEIFKKYNGKVPKVITNQKFNNYIKEIGKLAKITETITKGITKGGLKAQTKYKKYQLITSHTARRSFATNLFNDGLNHLVIMEVTGHKSEKSFLRYIKSTSLEKANLIRLHWQEKGKLLKKA